MKMMIETDEIFELMMHMIGYGNTAENLIDAMNDEYYNFSDETIATLARWCDERWGTDIGQSIRVAKEE